MLERIGERERERTREKAREQAPPMGVSHTAVSSLSSLSLFGTLAMHAHAPSMLLKPLGPGIEPHSQPCGIYPPQPLHHGWLRHGFLSGYLLLCPQHSAYAA